MPPLSPMQPSLQAATAPRIGLVGATGAVGASIAAALSASTTPFAPIARSAAGLAAAFGGNPLATPRVWAPDTVAGMASAFRGLDTLIYLVGVPYDAFHLHPVLMRRTLEAARASGVERVLLIGTAYPFGRAQAERVGPDHPRAPHTRKGLLRREQEDVLMEAHAAGHIAAAILRLPDFYGPGVERSLLSDLFTAAATGRRATVLGPLDTPHEFAFVPDVGPVVRDLIAHEGAFGRSFNLAGAGTITIREAARLAFAAAGRAPKLMVAGKTMLRLAGLFDPVMRELVEMNYLMTEPVVFDDSALTALIGPVAKTPYGEGIARCVAAAASAAA